MPPRRALDRKDALAFAAIAAAAFSCYGWTDIARLGFYHDDWALLASMHFAGPGGLIAGLAAKNPGCWFRPLDLLIFSAPFAVFGARPLAWQLILLALNAGVACCAFRLLARCGVPRSLAALAAVLFLAFPNKDATMFWSTMIPNGVSLWAFLAAFLFLLDYVEDGRPASLAWMLALWAVSLTAYDQCFLLFPLALLPHAAPGPDAAARARRAAAAMLLAAAVFSILKFWLIPRACGTPYNKIFVLLPWHFRAVYWEGLKSFVGPAFLAYVARAILAAFRAAPLKALAAALLPWALWPQDEGDARVANEGLRHLVSLGAGIFVLGYLPIAVSNYTPEAFNPMNRVNEVPALGLIIAAAALLSRPRGRWPKAAACAACSAALAAHVAFAQRWAQAYRLELRARDVILAHEKDWPEQDLLLFLMRDHYVEHKAPVFLASWDISGAAQLWTEDPRRSADVIGPKWDFGPDLIRYRERSWPYPSVRLLDADQGLFVTPRPGQFRRLAAPEDSPAG